ncbi:ATP-binding protein [Phytoactinopolyspora mesophila]|nr:ATP-binding protein [Phytoactinopolyspora mesophila]
MSESKESPGSALERELLDDSGSSEELPVQISFEIIRLFSEGLYQSPHKAIEELVSNSYDAGARNVHVLIPRSGSDSPELQDSLWVIDDGTGMDASGFKQLWLVAESSKNDQPALSGRSPIGQFGIGKLAAYVLAWRLTHISKKDGRYYLATMDFRQVRGRRQNDPAAPPVTVPLQEVNEERAQSLLAEIENRDGAAWQLLFGDESSESWTAAALTDFKDLFSKFRPGVLSWVLRTGLPLVSDFTIFLDGAALESAKEEGNLLLALPVGGKEDEQAEKLEFTITETGVQIPGIEGEVQGTAKLYETPLSRGKSLQYGRSHGFFVRVRGRVINLEDELFGIEALNHAAWSRFVFEVNVDGLREFLLSSREGVRESEPIYLLKEYLRAKFNACRAYYEKQKRQELVGLDIKLLLQDASASVLAEPLIEAVRQSLTASKQPSHYITSPTDIPEHQRESWLTEFEKELAKGPFDELEFQNVGPYDRLAEYNAADRKLIVNEEHPFVAKVISHSKNMTPATLFATSEIITDALIREAGIDPIISLELFSLRDRALRQIAGDQGPDPATVLRHLSIADQDKDALERAVGEAFITLGFRYDRRGGNRGGPDGVLDARLGFGDRQVEDFRVVYDAKTTASSSISVGHLDFGALWDFKLSEDADHGFIIGKAFQGQDDPESAVNRRTSQGRGDRPMTVMTTAQLKRLVELHYQFGVTLIQIRKFFVEALTFAEVTEFLDSLEAELSTEQPPVPLRRLLHGLEREKDDPLSRPNIIAVRAQDQTLKAYEVERLAAALRAVQTIVGSRWIEVNEANNDVRMGHTADQILAELDRRSQKELGLTARTGEGP